MNSVFSSHIVVAFICPLSICCSSLTWTPGVKTLLQFSAGNMQTTAVLSGKVKMETKDFLPEWLNQEAGHSMHVWATVKWKVIEERNVWPSFHLALGRLVQIQHDIRVGKQSYSRQRRTLPLPKATTIMPNMIEVIDNNPNLRKMNEQIYQSWQCL